MPEYMPRMIDDFIEKRMKLYGAILIEGCKWCGKSTTGRRFSKTVLEFQNPDMYQNYKMIANTQPSLLLENEKPLMIDEWQTFPVLWDSVRYDVDKTKLKGQYILTGSATPLVKNEEGEDEFPKHTGTGRIVRVLMRPMSLYESRESTGSVSLKSLFEGNTNIRGVSKKDLKDIAFMIARGGWPESIEVSGEDALIYAKDYVDATINNDIHTVDGVERNPFKVRSVLKSLARNTSSSASISTIKSDVIANNEDVSDKTINDYIVALEKMFIIENVEAWKPALRSKTTIRTSKKRTFVDPSLAMASLNATDKDLLSDFNTFGFMFENLCIRDLKIYAQNLDGDIFYYRDKNDLEVDAIIHLHNGKWAMVEVKLGSDEAIEEAADNLLKLKSLILTEKMGEPEFMMVLTGTQYAYTREDGVLVCPITCLKN